MQIAFRGLNFCVVTKKAIPNVDSCVSRSLFRVCDDVYVCPSRELAFHVLHCDF